MIKKEKIIRYNQAVSAVIGVVIMVAVTVTIGAVAYAYFNGLIGGGQTTVPAMSLEINDQTDRLSVSNADPDADWSRLYIFLKQSPGGNHIYFHQNADATITDPEIGVGPENQVRVTTASAIMSAGEYLDFKASAPSQIVTIILVDGPSNSIIQEYLFQKID